MCGRPLLFALCQAPGRLPGFDRKEFDFPPQAVRNTVRLPTRPITVPDGGPPQPPPLGHGTGRRPSVSCVGGPERPERTGCAAPSRWSTGEGRPLKSTGRGGGGGCGWRAPCITGGASFTSSTRSLPLHPRAPAGGIATKRPRGWSAIRGRRSLSVAPLTAEETPRWLSRERARECACGLHLRPLVLIPRLWVVARPGPRVPPLTSPQDPKLKDWRPWGDPRVDADAPPAQRRPATPPPPTPGTLGHRLCVCTSQGVAA